MRQKCLVRDIEKKKIHRFLQANDVGIFFVVIQMIGDTLTQCHNVGLAVVLTSEVNKMPRKYCLNKFYLRHNSAICDAM